jgi:hypothetical protein
MTPRLGRPRPPSIPDRIRDLERLVERVRKAASSPSRETIAPRLATSAWATTSATDVTDLVYLTHLLARNNLTVQGWAYVSDGATSGILQLWDFDNNLELARQTVTSTTQTQVTFTDVPYLGASGTRRDIRLRGWIASGSGSMSILPIYAYSAASPA